MNIGRSDSDWWQEKLDGQSWSQFASCWHYAFSTGMKSCGPEWGHVGAMKYTETGERLLLATSFADLEQFYKTAVTEGSCVTVPKLANFYSEMTQEMANNYCKTFKIYRGTCGPGSFVHMPAGFCFAEASASGTQTFGLRWLMWPVAGNKDDFMALAKLRSPPDVAPNDQTALMCAVRTALS